MAYFKRFWGLYLTVSLVFVALVSGGSRAVTAVAESTPVPREHIFILDAGHGGEDGGAVSCTGVYESQLNLEIALRLEDMMHFLGFATKMVRTTDISIYTEGGSLSAKKLSDLKQRVGIVNALDHAVLVSIHQNIFQDSRYSGAQVFYNDLEAKAMAEALQTAFRNADPSCTRRCKKSQGVYLMQHIQRPGVLIECGFLSNPSEEAKLRTPEYQKKISCIIATTFSQILSNT